MARALAPGDADGVRTLIVPAADLLLGARCAGCGGPALVLCRDCGTLIRPDPVVVPVPPTAVGLHRPTRVRAVASGAHAAVLRRVVLAWKEDGVSRLTDVLAHHLAAAVVPHVATRHPVLLVPVPTSRRSRRARGTDLVDELARSAARLLRSTGLEVGVEQALGYTRVTRDQAGLDAEARRSNVDGAFSSRRTGRRSGGDIVVVDDIWTTGATSVEAVRALTAAGRRPIGISVIAATPRRS